MLRLQKFCGDAPFAASGQILDLPSLPTLADGTAGGVEANSLTFDLCQTLIDQSQLVEETDILKSINLILQEEHLLIEGAAGLAVAAFLKLGQEGMYRDKTVVIVLCGGNVDLEKLKFRYKVF
ncbi:MAG: pyridoxal-phosphate dependent enzyme [Deinococcales bacterium]